MSEHELVTRCLEQDAAAWGELFDRYQRLVFHVITHRGGLSGEDAKDAAAETWCKCVKHLSELKNVDDLAGWLARIAFNCAIDVYRARQAMDPLPDTLPSAADDFERLELRAMLLTAIAKLSRREQAFVSAMLDDPCPTELARRAGLERGSVKTTRTRLFKKLRAILKGETHYGQLEFQP